MESNTYCGASDEHVHYNNHELISEDPIKLFGIDGTDETTIWLDMKNCSGTMDSTTFSLLSNVEYISMDKCDIQNCSKAFAPLEKLTALHIKKSTFPLETESFEDSQGITSLQIHDAKIPTNPCFQHLDKLTSISFELCSFDTLNGDLFMGLTSLKGVSMANCKIGTFKSSAFINVHLESLNIRDCEISEISFDMFSKLNLKFLSFHHNKIESEVDYAVFEQIESLDTIHFDSSIYKTLNFDNFSNLLTVKIGYKGNDEDDPEIDSVVEKLKLKDIKTEYVFCGTIDYDSDEMEECY